MKRALVSQTRMPETDRDSGSRQIDWYIRWLLSDGWSVTFVASDTNSDARHAHRLRQLGVTTFEGYDEIEEIVNAGDFDLALLAFWKQASQVTPVLREHSPHTKILIDSVDLHFLRDARRTLAAGLLDEEYGRSMVGELNTYRAADAVMAVSEKESGLLADFLGPERNYVLPLAEPAVRSEIPFEGRKGILFVGNFLHLPNTEAVEYLVRDILPRLDPDLLGEHPLSVIGSRIPEKTRAMGRGLPSVRILGWVPNLEPYLEQTRVSVVPLLHGAGVKRKIVQSLISGTPVLTTPIGAEGLDIRHDEHALIADGPSELAAGLTRLLTIREDWQRIADAGYEHARARHDPELLGQRFLEIVEDVLALPAREELAGTGLGRMQRTQLAYRDTVKAVNATLRSITDPGSTVLVVSRGDDKLAGVEGRNARHFPESPDGKWAGYHPADSEAAMRHLEVLRERGARYFALPSTSFWWLHHYRELAEHLETKYKRIHSDEHLVLFDIGKATERAPAPPAGQAERVLVIGTYRTGRAGAPPSLVADLERSERYQVTQRWRAGDDPLAEPDEGRGDADWTVFVSDEAVVPAGFLDDFLTAASQLLPLGVERVQPPHANGPDGGPPVTERVGGVLAREVEVATPLPVLAVRGNAAVHGPVALVDAVAITLGVPLVTAADPSGFSNVRDVFVAKEDGAARAVRRSQGSPAPLISVLIATYERADLLSECLERFCEQTLPVADFEIVVVDDGSADDRVEEVLEEMASRLPLTLARIEHAGRAAAKNLAVMLARGEVVLFFDDDDWPTPDLLAEHVRVHQAHPAEEIAVLGRTDWSPMLDVTPLMRHVTEVDPLLFSYDSFEAGERIDWRGFWEGRVSSKRSLHLRHGLHDQRLDYSIDIEMAWRLARYGLEVIYEPRALSYMARPVDFEAFCQRHEAKGRAQAAIAALHDDPEIREYTRIEGAVERWQEARPTFGALVSRIAQLEAEFGPDGGSEDDPRRSELHEAYRAALSACDAKGIAEALQGAAPSRRPVAARTSNRPGPTPPLAREPDRPKAPPATAFSDGDGHADGAEPPELTVTMPVWSRTSELAEMAVRTIDRIWDVARLPMEMVVVDNGSPEQRDFRARVHRFEENRGVATAWNTGIELARADVVAVLNSDCKVEPGWDEALCEAVTTGRRIAFPYTDHCDGLGYRRADQAGTAGWCFMLSREIFREVGPFDERFNPAYVEDTDYWHRAWELGIELTPVVDARVVHARRTSSDDHSDWLLKGHRYLYGWKHGVEPMRAPPYYNREIVEYRSQRAGSRATTT